MNLFQHQSVCVPGPDLLLQYMFSVSVGDLAWLPNKCGVDHVPARHLLVQLLKAEQKGSVTEPWHGGLRHPLEVHVARQYRQVWVSDVRWVGGGMTIRDQHIEQQLENTALTRCFIGICLLSVYL